MTPPIPTCEEPDAFLSPSHPKFFRYLFLCCFLVVFGGIMSGLQQALMQISKAQLSAMKREGTPEERSVAKLLEPLVLKRHLTLVTLLIGNALAMEALPVFMDNLVPKSVAIILSVTAVVFFSEIIPQAVCLKYPLELAAFFSRIMLILVAIFYPISAPIAALLDFVFGRRHESVLTRSGLRELITLHGSAKLGQVLRREELDIIQGALDLNNVSARESMTPIASAFMLSMEDQLNDSVMMDVAKSGHSRVPVYRRDDRTDVVGLLLVKQLIRLERHVKVKDLEFLFPVLVTREDVSLFTLLGRFCRGESHMAIVASISSFDAYYGVPPPSSSSSNGNNDGRGQGSPAPHNNKTDEDSMIRLFDFAGDDGSGIRGETRGRNGAFPSSRLHALGILTLEDVLEKLLKKDIRDEKDVWRPIRDDIEARLHGFIDLKEQLRAVGMGVTLREEKSASSPSSPIINIARRGESSAAAYGTL